MFIFNLSTTEATCHSQLRAASINIFLSNFINSAGKNSSQ